MKALAKLTRSTKSTKGKAVDASLINLSVEPSSSSSDPDLVRALQARIVELEHQLETHRQEADVQRRAAAQEAEVQRAAMRARIEELLKHRASQEQELASHRAKAKATKANDSKAVKQAMKQLEKADDGEPTAQARGVLFLARVKATATLQPTVDSGATDLEAAVALLGEPMSMAHAPAERDAGVAPPDPMLYVCMWGLARTPAESAPRGRVIYTTP